MRFLLGATLSMAAIMAAPALAIADKQTTLEERVADLEHILIRTTPRPQAAPPPAPPVVPPPHVFPQVSLGGVTRMNAGYHDQDAATEAVVGVADDGLTFRTTRLWAKGQLSADVGFQTELDFAQPGRPNFQNAYIELQHLPGNNVLRLGRWKQPFSLETQTSIRFLTFIERATLFTFVPFRRTGLGLLGCTDNGDTTWGASVFRAGDDNFGSDTGQPGGFALAARATHLIFDRNDGNHLLHVGGAYHYNDPVGDRVRYATAPEFVLGSNIRGNTPVFVDSGTLVADNHDVWGAEAAWVNHSFSVQAEYAKAHAQQLLAPDVSFPAGYVMASYFLTGEHRQYNHQLGAFDRLKVCHPFESRGGDGAGAFELTGRYSFIDLEDQDVRGRQLEDWTAGVNWHINDHSKVLVNYVRAHLEANDATIGRTSIVGAQAVYDF